ncbi:MAG TPA: hypothetical protein VG297_04820 [Bryobacteraceae bacterium]|nr:hypothetical protein [Bryobacteraceae bacterium]
MAHAQFKEVGPPPFTPAVAHQKMKALLADVNAANRQQTVTTISGWLVWYRDIFDEELSAAWKRDDRANLLPLVKDLADAKVASAIVEFSWREQRAATFNLTYAPMFVELMSRYADSARPVLDDLLGRNGQSAPQLSQSEAESVCRIFIDMPDTDAWRRTAQQVLPLYRRVAEGLLDQDVRSDDQEKSWHAQMLLKGLSPGSSSARFPTQPPRRTGPVRTSGAYEPPIGDAVSSLGPNRPDRTDESGPPDRALPPPVAVQPAPLAPKPLPSPPVAAAYNGPHSGTLECRAGVVIPQNGEYVFRDLPPGKLQLDYDMKTWDVRIAPGDGGAQRLILTNKRPRQQKRCTVRWSLAP